MSTPQEIKGLQLLFDRPAEPIISLKGNENIMFSVPSNFLEERYQSLQPELANRFGEEVSEVITVEPVQDIDLSAITELGKDEAFSPFIPRHGRIASQLIEILMNSPNVSNLQSTGLYCKERCNAALFNYCISIALLHREDTQNVPVPSLFQAFPDRFVDSQVIQPAREEAEVVVNTASRVPIIIPKDYTASDLEEEHRCAYWREDIGLNLHHWHWHLVYPFEGPRIVLEKDRRGELFYYMHEQIQARYNFERLSNMLARVKKFQNFREPIAEAYYPKLDTIIASRGWAPRQANMVIRDINRPIDGLVITVNEFENSLRRIYDVIHTKQINMPDGSTMPLRDDNTGIDILGNLIESTSLSVNRGYYGNFHNLGHVFLGYVHDPDGRYLERFGVMADPATDLRDPIFFRLHALIDDIFQEYKGLLPTYSRAQLSFPDIRVSDVSVLSESGTREIFETHWTQSDLDLSRGLDFVRGGEIFVRYQHLDCRPFTYQITVENSGEARMGTVRIFLAPSNDERGLPWQLREQRLMFIELDKFTTPLQPGRNEISRTSADSSVTVPFERTFRNLEVGREGMSADAFNFCGCGWPQHLLIPRGTLSGMPCQLFVMVSNGQQDIVQQTMDGVCADAASYCGIRSRLYPDLRPMGFPFDRPPNNRVGTINDFLTSNMFLKNVTVRFTDTVVQNPRNRTTNSQNIN